jgi:general stress protein 26
MAQAHEVTDSLDKLYDLVCDIEIGMLTTRRPDGHLVSRAMATQKRVGGADLWFMTTVDTHKLDELEQEPHVNVAYYKDRTREWVSVAGLAKATQDRAKIAELFAEDWKAWLPDEGDPRHGTPEDPRIVLIGVDVHSATWFKAKAQPVVLFEMAKGYLTRTEPDMGSMHHAHGRA